MARLPPKVGPLTVCHGEVDSRQACTLLSSADSPAPDAVSPPFAQVRGTPSLGSPGGIFEGALKAATAHSRPCCTRCAQTMERRSVQAWVQPRTAVPARACARWCGSSSTTRRRRTPRPPPCRTPTPTTALGVYRHHEQACEWLGQIKAPRSSQTCLSSLTRQGSRGRRLKSDRHRARECSKTFT